MTTIYASQTRLLPNCGRLRIRNLENASRKLMESEQDNLNHYYRVLEKARELEIIGLDIVSFVCKYDIFLIGNK